MKSKLPLIVFFSLLILQASAQNDNREAIFKAAAGSNIRAKLTSPFGASSLPNVVSNISVSSFLKEGVNGKAEIQGKFRNGCSGGITVDQKIGKSDNSALLLDLTGVSPGTTVKFNFQKMVWHPKFNLTDPQIDTGLMKVSKAYAQRKGIADSRTVGLDNLSTSGTDEEKRAALAAFRNVKFAEPLFVNFEVGFTKTSFSFATDSFTLKENSEVHLTPTLKFSLVKAIGSGLKVLGYWALSYNYAESYVPGDDIDFIIPFGTSRNYSANTLAFGKPTKQTSHNVSAEFRKNIFTPSDATVAISPTATYSINKKKLSIFVPIYFIRGVNPDGKLLSDLQGGIRLGYITSTKSGQVSSFKDGFVAQLIVTKPLDFLERL